MTSFQIQCFLSVAKYLNFTEAANHLFIAQSSLSRNISNLETELGMPLFIRTKKYVRLTPSGAVLYEEFSKLMLLANSAIERAKNAELGQSGSLKLGIIETQRSENFLPKTLNLLRDRHPNIQIDIASGNFRDLRNALAEKKIDVALTMDFDLRSYPSDEIVYQFFFQSHPLCVISKSHPLAQEENLSIESLRQETLIAISPEISEGAYQNIVQLCELHGFTPSKIILANSIQNLLLQVQSGLGFSVLDENCISCSNSAVRSFPVDRSDLLGLVAIWQKENLNPVIPLFTNLLVPKEEVEEKISE